MQLPSPSIRIVNSVYVVKLSPGRRSKKTKAVSGPSKCAAEPELALALNDIGLGSALEQILNDEQWLDDASGVIPHCLAILRICHALTERLAELAMRPMSSSIGSSSTAKRDATVRLIEATKRVPFRVDDVVRSMNPPFDLRLLEARLAALVLAVGQVALLTQSVVQPGGVDGAASGGAGGVAVGRWIDEGLNDMDARLLVLRQIARQQTADEQSGASRVFLSSSQV